MLQLPNGLNTGSRHYSFVLFMLVYYLIISGSTWLVAAILLTTSSGESYKSNHGGRFGGASSCSAYWNLKCCSTFQFMTSFFFYHCLDVCAEDNMFNMNSFFIRYCSTEWWFALTNCIVATCKDTRKRKLTQAKLSILQERTDDKCWWKQKDSLFKNVNRVLGGKFSKHGR